MLALTAQTELLLAATEDRLHQTYRAPVMPGSVELMGRLRAMGLAATISGAGPSVLVLASGSSSDLVARVATSGISGYAVVPLAPVLDGVRVDS